MDYCGEQGIPLGWFLGGPYEWDDFSRDAALAWDLNRKIRCATCNEYEEDWLDEKGLRRVGRKAPKQVSTYICPGCEAIEQKLNAQEGEPREGAKTILLPRKAVQPASPKPRRARRE
jgi:uncharacterized protein YlaI